MDWKNIDWDNLNLEILKGNFGLNSMVTVRIGDEVFTRRVYNSKDDLYIVVHNYKFCFMDFINKGGFNEDTIY